MPRHRGKLKVFLGMAPFVGKTVAMLQTAASEKQAGRNVLLAIMLPHGVKTVEALASRFPRLAAQSGIELDVDEIIRRHPDIVLVDELAHSNAAQARHPKRFQDVLELLVAGIDVYTTLNVYEIASRSSVLWQASGTDGRSTTVPDGVLDEAEVVLVDLAPSEVLQRQKLARAKMQEAEEKPRLFGEGDLLMLREMAARFYAERIAR